MKFEQALKNAEWDTTDHKNLMVTHLSITRKGNMLECEEVCINEYGGVYGNEVYAEVVIDDIYDLPYELREERSHMWHPW